MSQHEAAAAPEKVATHIPGLDVLLKGGIPRGRITLITGRPGTFKSRAALQIACGVASTGGCAVFLTVEERPEDLRQSGDSMGFRVSAWEAAGRLRIVDFRLPSAPHTELSGPFDVAPLVEQLKVACSGATAPPLVVIDSLPALLAMQPRDELVRRTIHAVMLAVDAVGATGIVISERVGEGGDGSLFGIEEFLADAVLVLRSRVDQKQRRRTIEVAKYRTSDHMKGEYPTAITGTGLTVFPLDMQQRSVPAAKAEDRIGTGVPGLDQLMNGGFIRDSVSVVRGPSGSGKTTLAGTCALAAVKRGERVFYFGFEEPEAILMRNFTALGLPLQTYRRAGLLRVSCAFPEAAGIEDLFAELQRQLDGFDPQLIVLDSISSVEHAVSADAFRQFIVGLASLVRRHGRSALMTQTVPQVSTQESAPYLSTLADAILLLEFRPEHPKERRTIRVLKMRGSEHDLDRHAFSIEAGSGMRVGEVVPEAGLVHRSTSDARHALPPRRNA